MEKPAKTRSKARSEKPAPETRYAPDDQAALYELAAHLNSLKEERGLSTSELARRAGINRSYLAETLAGKRNIAYLNLRQLAEGLDLSLAELLAFHVPPTSNE